MSPTALWTTLKTSVSSAFFSYHKATVSQETDTLFSLQQELSKLLTSPVNDPNHIVSCRAKIASIVHSKLNRARQKYRSTLLNNRELPSRFMFKGLKERKSQNTFKSFHLSTHPSTLYTGPLDILRQLYVTYSKRFSFRPQSTLQSIQELFLGVSQFKVFTVGLNSTEDQETLDQLITAQEVGQAILSSRGSLTSGPDGLARSFYSLLQDDGLNIIAAHFNSIACFQSTPPHDGFSFNKALLVPIPKRAPGQDGRDHHSELDVRIIALINNDMKLLAKIILSRLRDILPKILKRFTFSTPGRNIQHSVLLHYMIARSYSSSCQKQSIINFDFENAFDHVSLTHLFQTFIDIFHNTFTYKLLFFMLTTRMVAIKYCGFVSPFFHMGNGILQGCPLSSVLYSIYLNALMRKLDILVKGVKIAGTQTVLRSLSYVDDLSIFSSSPADTLVIYKVVRRFAAHTGSTINFMKTKCFPLQRRNCDASHIKAFKIFGFFPFREDATSVSTFLKSQLTFVSTFITIHRHINLSIRGRVRVVNFSIISRLVYHCTFVKFSVAWIQSFNRLIFSFIWRSFPHLARRTLFLPAEFGGLGLINPRIFFTLQRILFLSKLRLCSSLPVCLHDAAVHFYSQLMGISEEVIVSASRLVGLNLSVVTHLPYNHFITHSCIRLKLSRLPASYIRLRSFLHIPSNLFNFLYLLSHRRLPVGHTLHFTRHLQSISPSCVFCYPYVDETIRHCLFQCPHAFSFIQRFISLPCFSIERYNAIIFTFQWDKSLQNHILPNLLIAYSIWIDRCNHVFNIPFIPSIPSLENIFRHQMFGLLDNDREVVLAPYLEALL